MGTPPFAVPSLEALIRAGHRVRLVVTQPDRPAGRGQQVQFSAVKQAALAHGLPILQPGRLRREPEAMQRIREVRPDLACVVAFGQILPQEVLDIPLKGCLNVHGSLLPAYRGAGPIQWALINGDERTGVTTMLMDAGMDTGPMLLAEPLEIAPDDTASTLSSRMADQGADLLVRTIDAWLQGAIEARPQPRQGVSMAPMLKKSDGLLDWSQPARSLLDRIRGTTPWPGAQTGLQAMPVKVVRAQLGPQSTGGAPGSVLEVDDRGWLVQAGEGTLWLAEIQVPGKRPQLAAEAARGLRQLTIGTILG